MTKKTVKDEEIKDEAIKEMQDESNVEEKSTEEQETLAEDAEKDGDDPTKTDETESLLTKEEELEIAVAESKDKYLRLYSEYENFRRRTAKEKIDLISSAGADILTAILPIIDDFERSEANMEKADFETLKAGNELIKNKLKNILSQKGLKPMEVEKGSDFNADFHEAIAKVPVPEESLKGKVIDVTEKGYFVGEKVIRFAKVVIGE